MKRPLLPKKMKFLFIRSEMEQCEIEGLYFQYQKNYNIECNYFDTNSEKCCLHLYFVYFDIFEFLVELLANILAFLFRGQQRWPEMYKWKENKEKMSFISKMSGYDTVIDCTDQTEFQYCLTSKPVSDGGGIFGKSLELSLKQKSMNKFEISIPTDSTLDLLNRATLSQIEEYISRVLDTGTLNTSQKDIEDIKISIDEIKKELVNDVHEKSRMEAIFKNLRAIKGTAEFANAVVTLYQFILSVIK